ncbi:MAG: hypothetical protein JEZ09_10330 [Salinivirgaceae bacterium]|nr:hypothetical protein [Salinivirgaceae bacterium]
MDKETFYQYIKFPELLDDRSLVDLEKIVEEYPYFQTAHLLYLKNLNNQGSIKYDQELKRTAVWVSSRDRLFYLLDKRVLLPVSEPFLIDEEKKQVANESSETFDFTELTSLTEFKEESSSKTKEIDDELSQLIMSGAAQSLSFYNVDDKVDLEDFKNTFGKNKPSLSMSEAKAKTSRDNLIDKFIDKQPKIIPKEKEEIKIQEVENNDTVETSDMITDTLAKIYIKQGLYEKAIFAYEKLSLKYPEKNIYFAGQIKKIKQLINNQ